MEGTSPSSNTEGAPISQENITAEPVSEMQPSVAPEDIPHTNMFVKGLPFSMPESKLRELFAECGEIESCKLLVDFQTSQSKGVGFVKYQTKEGAAAAINKYNGATIEGQSLTVKPATTDGSTPLGEDEPSARLYIAGLPPNINEAMLASIFEQYGNIVHNRVVRVNGMPKGQAFIHFSSVEEARAAKDGIGGQVLPQINRSIIIKYEDSPEQKALRRQKNAQKFGGDGGARFNPMGSSFRAQPAPHGASPYVNGSFPPPYGQPQQMNYGPPGGYGQNRPPHQQQQQGGANKDDLFVYNVPLEADESWLQQTFTHYGQIVNVHIMRTPDRQSKGFGFVKYANPQSGYAAIQALNGYMLANGRKLQVSFKR